MRQYLNENDTINSIRLELRHPAGKSSIWVLVEGETDVKLYTKLLNAENVKVEEVHGGGVGNLRKAVDTLVKETDRVIGIRDSDFLRLDGKKETVKYLFTTDAHDAEMTIVQCDHAFSSVVAEFAIHRLKDFDKLREEILESLVYLSGLRWKNAKENLEFNFKGLGIGTFYDGNTKVLEVVACTDNVHKRSPNKKKTVTSEEVELLVSHVTDHPNLCNGHDFVKAFSLHATAISGKGIAPDDVEAALRVAYRREDFKKTDLFQLLKDWEKASGHTLFA